MAWYDWQRLIGLRKDVFPGSATDHGSTGMGPDFPDSAGDRERGKFRPGQFPRLTTVAVSNDDGSPILAGGELLHKMDELILEMRRLRQGLVLNDVAEDIDKPDMRA